MVRLAITGGLGRMGKAIGEVSLNAEADNYQVVAAVHKETSSYIGMDFGTICAGQESGIKITESLQAAQNDSEIDVVIDFTLPDASLINLQFCVDNKLPIVIGTTGFDEDQKQKIVDAAKMIPVVYSPNMSVGVNLSFYLLKLAAQVIGADSDIEISETHHRNKVDAPSGTALQMGKVIAEQLGSSLEQCAVYDRNAEAGARRKHSIGFATQRAGDVVGEHTVLFANEGERLEISHKASSRSTFAKGALRAASWLVVQPPGLYDMSDVLGLGNNPP